MKIDLKKSLFFLLILFSSIFFFYLGIQDKVESIPVDASLGLLNVISFYWYLSLVISIILCVLCFFYFDLRWQFWLSIFLLVLILYGLPLFVETNPRSADTFWHMNSAFEIIHQEYLGFEDGGSVGIKNEEDHRYSYLNTNPCVFMFFAVVLSLIGWETINLIIFAKIFSLIAIILIILLIFLFFKALTKQEKIAELSTFFCVLGNVYIQNHFSPQTIGLILMLVIMLCFLKKEKIYRVCAMLLSLLVVFIHLPTALFLFLFGFVGLVLAYFLDLDLNFIKPLEVLTLFCFYAFYAVFFVEDIFSKIFTVLSENFILISLALLMLVFFAFMFKKSKLSQNKNLVNLLPLFGAIILFSLIYVSSFDWINIGRLLRYFVLLCSSSILVYLCYAFFKKRVFKEEEIIIFSFLVSALVFFIFQFLMTSAFGLEDRSFLVYYLGFSCLVSLAILKHNILAKKAIFLMVILLLLNTVTIYYHENHYMISSSDMSGWDYVYEISNTEDLIFGNIDYYSMYYTGSYNELTDIRYVDRYNLYESGEDLVYDYYVLNNFNAFSHYLYGDLESYYTLVELINNNSSYNQIYSSNGLSIIEKV